MRKERAIRLVNEDGEQVGSFSPDTHYIRTKKQDDFVKSNAAAKEAFNEYNEENGKFIWAYPEQIKKVIHSDEFTKSDLTMVFYLATFVNGKGYLTHNNNNTKLTKETIQEKLSVSYKGFLKFFNKLLVHGILTPSGNHFAWNENYNFYGTTVGKAKPKMLVRTYVNQVRELYEATKINGNKKYSPTSLYPVFALVPYLHRNSNIICKNPDVSDIENIEYFSLSEIASLLDLKDSKKMSSSLSGILLNGQTTFIKIISKNEVYLKLNPRIFWRDVVAPDARLIAEFDMIDNNRRNR
ncbi:hypothetical protein [Planococcus donghaensis]|uniref:hypothetical protein n=1 Tax=Planococcus donghaensis TaxID=414778 RepID=UPI0037363E55